MGNSSVLHFFSFGKGNFSFRTSFNLVKKNGTIIWDDVKQHIFRSEKRTFCDIKRYLFYFLEVPFWILPKIKSHPAYFFNCNFNAKKVVDWGTLLDFSKKVPTEPPIPVLKSWRDYIYIFTSIPKVNTIILSRDLKKQKVERNPLPS